MKGSLAGFSALILVVAALSLRGDTQKPREKPRIIDPGSMTQLVFFAVLEGLYEDGVSTDDVERILAVDPRTKQPRLEEHFVYSCPLCMPAFDAMVLYRSRPNFYGRKDSSDNFGPAWNLLSRKNWIAFRKPTSSRPFRPWSTAGLAVDWIP